MELEVKMKTSHIYFASRASLELVTILLDSPHLFPPDDSALAVKAMAQMLVEKGEYNSNVLEDINGPLIDRGKALFGAVQKRKVEIVKELIARGANVNSQFNNASPIKVLVMKNKDEDKTTEIIQILVKAGAKDIGEALITALEAKNRRSFAAAKQLIELAGPNIQVNIFIYTIIYNTIIVIY